jgi:hypothetical protein
MGSKGYLATDQPFKVSVDGSKEKKEETDETGAFNCSVKLLA